MRLSETMPQALAVATLIVAALVACAATCIAATLIVVTGRPIASGGKVLLAVPSEPPVTYMLAFRMDRDDEEKTLAAIERGATTATVTGSVRIREDGGERVLRVDEIVFGAPR